MLRAKLEFANSRLAIVNAQESMDMPTPNGATTSPATLRAAREVYQERQSLISKRMIADFERSKNKDAKALRSLIKKMNKRAEVIETIDLQV